MPRKGGRLTPKEISFAKAYAKTNDATFAAWQASYSSPLNDGARLVKRESVQSFARQETQRFLREDAGGIACAVLGEIALNRLNRAADRVRAAAELAKLSNIGLTDDTDSKPDHELTAAELSKMRRTLAAQREAIGSILDNMPRQTIEALDVLA